MFSKKAPPKTPLADRFYSVKTALHQEPKKVGLLSIILYWERKKERKDKKKKQVTNEDSNRGYHSLSRLCRRLSIFSGILRIRCSRLSIVFPFQALTVIFRRCKYGSSLAGGRFIVLNPNAPNMIAIYSFSFFLKKKTPPNPNSKITIL